MRFPRVALLVITILCGPASSACAHTPAQSTKPLLKEHADMTLPEAAMAEKIALSAEEMGVRFLKLITSLDSREDITPGRIQDVMGFRISVAPSALGAVIRSEDLGDGWRYAFDYVPASPSLLPGIGLSFENTAGRFSDMEAICSLDFQRYDSALKSAGFVASPTYGPIGQLENWRYAKFAERGSIVLSVIPQDSAAGTSSQVCVKSITTLNGR
ncbi:hypothetical protein [Xanthomonas sp. 4461]|uniref:hypothetical protein n=1 Tax=Xanthomonas sp. 4461 TaxID=3035313 RepID=UPI002DD69BBB|nr:hypothetical protein [Xanthomonas sp. 4461]